MSATTHHLPSASAVGVTNNQPKENAIITTDTTQVALAPTFNFVLDTDVNNRLKVARMAKQFASKPGVISSHVGTLQITEQRSEGGDFFTYQYSELVEVVYGEECELANKEANRPFTVLKAYFRTDEDVFALAFAPTGDTPTTYYYKMSDYGLLPSAGDSVTVDGVEYGVRGNPQTNLARKLMEALGQDGDQHASATNATAKRQAEEARKTEHEAKVAAAYAARDPRANYRTVWALEKAHGDLLNADEDGRKAYRTKREGLLTALTNCYHEELWAICQASLNHLRCETNITNSDEPYGFVTLPEVACFILTRWVDQGYGDQDIRKTIAAEFVRKHLS